MRIFTPEQMMAADRATIESGTPLAVLMERAGNVVGRAALRLAGGAYGSRVVIFCGKGNNAGDGFAAAKFLAAAGAFPVVVALEEARSLSGAALDFFQRLKEIRVVGMQVAERETRRATVVVDALLGTGFKGSLEADYASACNLINTSGVPVLSVDVPSGVDARTGAVDSVAVRADVTACMQEIKTGLVLYPGSEFAGAVVAYDIGIDTSSHPSDFELVDEALVASWIPHRNQEVDKRDVGAVLVVSGSVGMSGAPALVALGALRTGAGLVTVAAPASVARQLPTAVPETTTMLLAETAGGSIASEAISKVLERASKYDAVALGPGLSSDPQTVEFVRKLVIQLELPLVLDADAINAIAGDPEALAARVHPTLITPHVREMSRLLGLEPTDVLRDRLAAARNAARRTNATVLLKGYRTVVTQPDGATWVLAVGGPELATGGSGDVLTGICSAILAGISASRDARESMQSAALRAGVAGGWIHGRAGDLLAESISGSSVIASDIAETIPAVLQELR